MFVWSTPFKSDNYYALVTLNLMYRLDMEDPNWRSEAQLADMRAFKAAALDMQNREDRFVSLLEQLSPHCLTKIQYYATETAGISFNVRFTF